LLFLPVDAVEQEAFGAFVATLQDQILVMDNDSRD
jgi:hypothetical protein